MASDVVLGVEPLGFPWQTPDPFLFCVHHLDAYPRGNDAMGPAASLAGRSLGQDFEGRDGWRMYHGQTVPGFPQHPHRGFETLTLVRRGLVDHSDSLGATARFGGGDAQWLTAGEGIVHAEMFPLVSRDAANPLELFQIWINLPAADKLVPPHFSMLWAERIPRHAVRDEAGRVTEVVTVAGAYGGVAPPPPPPRSWASRAASELAVWTLRLEPGARFSLPRTSVGVTRTLYFFSGPAARIGGVDLRAHAAVPVRGDAEIPIEAGDGEIELLLLQGRPIGEPVVQYGPFVMNTREEIQRAMLDYRRTGFGGWPFPADDPVHPREQGRFARHADGRIERPT